MSSYNGHHLSEFDKEVHYPTRPVDKDKAEVELAIALEKATNSEEVAPKQKHVRKCIMYTWDYHSSISFWSGLEAQPIHADEVQTFKALILIHKVVQEGHPVTIKEGHGQTAWIELCATSASMEADRGYSQLIRGYVKFLLGKLRFHRIHSAFNGALDYDEATALKYINDPNEGYETISDLMNLQDQVDSFQKMVFAHLARSDNECRISALIPMVKESWQIYKFLTSMLRAMYRKSYGDALDPLKERYVAQHHTLRKFYHECSTLKYLTGLINVPKLGPDPPALTDGTSQPKQAAPKRSPTQDAPSASAAEVAQQAQLLKKYEEEHAALVAAQKAEAARQAELRRQQQEEFEQRQREQAERERLAQEQFLFQQQQQQMMYNSNMVSQQATELEQELLAMRGQYERDQIMLEQYDRRVNALETELNGIMGHVNSQLELKDELIRQLQDQINAWRNKYEALAKLYTQLRVEHLEMLSKFKEMQLKATTTQEVLDKMEKMERELKTKNLELADMLRERDRSRYEVDRQKSLQKEGIERIRRELNFANERSDDLSRSKNSEVSNVLKKFNRQISDLEASLRSKDIQLDDLHSRLGTTGNQMEHIRDEKDQEIMILQAGLDSSLQQLSEVKQSQGLLDDTTTAQIDTLILDNRKKLNDIIDSILQACLQKVDDAIYELESPIQAGNLNSTAEYTLSMIEQAINNATEFATVYNLYLSNDVGGEQVEVIKSANELAQSLHDVLINTKGILRLASDDDASDKIVQVAKAAGDQALRFFESLKTYKLDLLPPTKRKDVVIQQNSQARNALTTLSNAVDKLIPKGAKINPANGDLGDMVEREMLNAARAIEQATQRLHGLINRPRDPSKSPSDLQVHDSILASALAITHAITRLIKAATDSQQEIVAQGRGSGTPQQFYKRNHRWTEGLISAAKSVASATNLLIETADGVLSGTHSLDQLVVASNEVAAATAQLVAASRVKANPRSKTQERLEVAAKAVTEACKALVRQVTAVSTRPTQGPEVDYKNMVGFEFKKREMEQQVEILRLEKELGVARHRLGIMRRAGYHVDETDES
ncbi:cytoskeleton assembly control protein [Pluteus cervinus]|uniref:Cytoskeleton assembly control protein n=1 Tax=Pluteus cervinus TaxID=181527 RepID=A0ACD3BGT7_9AGAR|nr:cytoskeleton assembly control protein [Pluteus cervinus]